MHKKKIFNLVIALKHTGQTFTLKNFFSQTVQKLYL